MSNTNSDKIAAQLGWRINMKVTGELKSASASFVKLNSPALLDPSARFPQNR